MRSRSERGSGGAPHARRSTCHASRRAWIALLLVAISLPFAARAHAGAWTREYGGWFLKLGYDRWLSDERFAANGKRVAFEEPRAGFDDQDEYRSHALRTYVEHGYAEAWTITASTAFEYVESEARGAIDRTLGVSDLTFQLKRLIHPGSVVIAALAETKLPTGYDSARSPALGTGAADFGGRIQAGGSLGLVYLTGEVGYLVRGGALLDQVPYALEGGYSLTPEILVRAELRGGMTVGSDAQSVTPDGTFDPALANSRFLTGGAGLVLRGRPLDVVLGIEHVLSGENTLAGTRLSLSVWHTR